MTRNMIRALADAAGAVHHRGLERTRAGWRSTHPSAGVVDHHSFVTVHRLVDGGYLQLWSKGKVAHITEGGEAALGRWRERHHQ